jgi:WD40 repeat protein/serine/threonine protein kinase
MNVDRWRQIDDIFHEAVERQSADRSTYLKLACGGDEDLLAEVESLLIHNEQAQDREFLAAVPEDMNAAEPDHHLSARWFGPYELLEEVGRGGWGVVYKARQPSLNRLVAIKVILNAEFASDTERERFRNEAETLAILRHPNIVQVFDFGEHNGKPFFSMEFVSGGSLAQRLSNGPMAERDAAVLVETLARTLHAVHQAGIIHRDLKPTNVLLTAENTVKVTDFGISKSTDGDSLRTATGSIMGAPCYMAPEQARGTSKHIGPEADIYALGAILYESLTGRPPFRAATAWETMQQVIDQEVVAPNLLQPGLSPDITTICLKCLEKDPASRIQSAEFLADECRRVIDGVPTITRPVTAAERLWRWAKRKPVVASLVGTVAILLVAVAAISAFFALRIAEKNLKLIQANTDLEEANVSERTAKQDAEAKGKEAITARDEARSHLYDAHMTLAQSTWEQSDVGQTVRLLDLYRSPAGKGDAPRDLRSFEWYYWDRLSHSELLTLNLKGHTWPLCSVAFSRDGKRLASASLDYSVRVYDAATGKEIFTLPGHTDAVRCVAFSQDGTRLASASNDTTVKVWDTTSRREMFTLRHSVWICSVAFSSDGMRLASASGDVFDPITPKDLTVWDATNGNLIRTWGGHNFAINSVAFSPDGTRLASASFDKTVKVWDATSGRKMLWSGRHTKNVTSVTFSQDGKRLATASEDYSVKVWDATSGGEMLTLRGHTSDVNSVAFSPDGARLASASNDKTVKVWDATSGEAKLMLKGHTSRVTSVAFSQDGKRLRAASFVGKVKEWDSISGQKTLTLKGHTGRVTSVAFSQDGQRLASASEDRTMKMWDVTSGQATRTLKEHTGGAFSIAFNADGEMLASARGDPDNPGTLSELRVWDVTSKPKQLTLKEHTGGVTSASFSRDGKLLASASLDRIVTVWNATSGQKTLTLTGHNTLVRSVAFSANGKWLASGGGPEFGLGEVKLWDATSGLESVPLKGVTRTVMSVAFSPDGKLLAAASIDETVKIWDTTSGQQTLTLKGHSGTVMSVAFSPDGKRLVSASDDQTVKVWDITTGQATLTLIEHTGQVTSVAFSPDGKRLASASDDGTIKVWGALQHEADAAALKVRQAD